MVTPEHTKLFRSELNEIEFSREPCESNVNLILMRNKCHTNKRNNSRVRHLSNKLKFIAAVY